MLAVITESVLESWVDAHPEKAPGLVADLIYWLVSASCPHPLERRFPLSDSIGQHGQDGVLNVDPGYEPYIPNGLSCWEFGSGRDAKQKATDDYDKHTPKVPEDKRKQSTFVFVTPRSALRVWRYTWKIDEQAAWIEERRNRNEWKDARVIDGTQLVSWIHRFPPVESWLASILLPGTANNIRTLKKHWEDISTIEPSPSLNPALFLVNQEDACQGLQQVFDGCTSQLRLLTRFPDHVVNFVSAFVASLEINQRIRVYSRSLIVSDLTVWNTICERFSGDRFILVADPVLDLSGPLGSAAIQRARNSGHSVVYNAPPGGKDDGVGIYLRSPQGHQIKESLLGSGYPEQKANTLAYRCERNLSFLLRLLRGHSANSALGDNSVHPYLPLALLVGSWAHNSESDRKTICELAEIKYAEWIQVMREIYAVSNPPIVHQNGDWKFIARYEGWFAMGNKLYDEHLDKFHQIAVSVLRERDPQFDLSQRERPVAAIREMVLQHSPSLRKGIAESLALLGSHPKALTSCTIGKALHTANRTVHDILAGADWKLWASMNSLLPLLAEASPSEFMGAVEDALSQTPCPFDQLFAQEGEFLHGTNHMLGLLWALETLAWEEQFLLPVSELLGNLACRDPGGTWSNRPSNSLARIFLPVHPFTTAPIGKRITAVKSLVTTVPSAAWPLLLSLTQTENVFTQSTSRPAWRDTIPDTWEENISQPEYQPKFQQQFKAYTQMLVDIACSDFTRLIDEEFIHQLPHLPPELFQRIVDHISSGEIRNSHETQRLKLWTELSRLVRRHKAFPDSWWSADPETIKKIENAIEGVGPTDQSTVNRILFSGTAHLLYDEVEDYSESERIHEDLCQSAIAELLASGSIEEVFKLAEAVENPNQVAYALAVHANQEVDARILPSLLHKESNKWLRFTRGYLSRRLQKEGWGWVDSLVSSSWTAKEKALLLSQLPFEGEVWNRVAKLLGSQEGLYWRNASANLHRNTQGEIGNAIEKLIVHGQPRAAIRCVWIMLTQERFYRDHAVSALLSMSSSEEILDQDFRHEATEIIRELQSDLEQNSQALWYIEWAYLGLLDRLSRASPVVLENRLASDPDFYCQLIQCIFFPKGMNEQTEELNESDRASGRAAYSLLRGWKTPPGLQTDGTFSYESFSKWLKYVKKSCRESGHAEIALDQVGEVLVYCPPDPKGLWIHEAVAEELNAIDASDMRDGFSRGIRNSRGMHRVDPSANPERDLATKYHRKADEVEGKGLWRFAKALRDLALYYEQDAERVISEAEKKE